MPGARKCDEAVLDRLDPLVEAMKSGDLAAVIEITDALSRNERRPVIESSVCIGFRLGCQFEILDWLARAVGTLEVSQEEWGTQLRRVKPRACGGAACGGTRRA